MATLNADVIVWSLREDIVVRDVDFSAVRYQEKSTVSKERVYFEDKRNFVEARNCCLLPKNTRYAKLKDSIREFEELLSTEKVVWSEWRRTGSCSSGEEPCRVLQVLLCSGVLCTAVVSAVTGDLRYLTSDKFLTGRLLSDSPAHAAVTDSHVLISYNDARLSVLHLDSCPPPLSLGGSSISLSEASLLPPMASRRPNLQVAQLAGPHGRRFQRRLSVNATGQLVVVWWERTEDEIFPWSPVERDCRDRANMLVYRIDGAELTLLCHARSQLPPLSVSFSFRDPALLLTVEQGFDSRGGVTVLSCVYEVRGSLLERASVTSIPLEAPVSCHSHSPREDRLALACNNGVVALHSHSSTHFTRAALCPSTLAWLQPGALIAVANHRGQVQLFDMALSLVRVQLGEDVGSLRLLDFSDYFCHQPSLTGLSWAPAPAVASLIATGEEEGRDEDTVQDKSYLDTGEESSSLLLLLHYSRGPFTCLRFTAPHFSLTHPITEPMVVQEATCEAQDKSTVDTHNVSSFSNMTTSSTTSSNTSSSFSKSSSHSSSTSLTSSSSSPSKSPAKSSEVTSKCTDTVTAVVSGEAAESRALHYCSICPDVLVGEYLAYGQVEEATNLCSSLCWEQDGGLALKCVAAVVNYIIRRANLSAPSRLTAPSIEFNATTSSDATTSRSQSSDAVERKSDPDKKSSADAAILQSSNLWERRVLAVADMLASGFLSPLTPLRPATEETYGPPVRALARRLYFRLLRGGCYQSCLSLARYLGDIDCFLRLHRTATHQHRGHNSEHIASEALKKARVLQKRRALAAVDRKYPASSSTSCSSSTRSSSPSSASCCSSCSLEHSYISSDSDSEWSSDSDGSSCSSSTCSCCSEEHHCSEDLSCSTVSQSSYSTCSSSSEEQRGEREWGDGSESEVISSTTAVPVSKNFEDSLLPDRLSQVPRPLPRTNAPSQGRPPPASTLTYYDPVLESNCTLVYTGDGGSMLPSPTGERKEGEVATCSHLLSSAERLVNNQYREVDRKQEYFPEALLYPRSADESCLLSYANMTSFSTSAVESGGSSAPQLSYEDGSQPSTITAFTSQDGKVTINITQKTPKPLRISRRSSNKRHSRRNSSAKEINVNSVEQSKDQITLVQKLKKPSSHVHSLEGESNKELREKCAASNKEIHLSNKKHHRHRSDSSETRTSEHFQNHAVLEAYCDSAESNICATGVKPRHIIAFGNRRSQRNLVDALDAADSAVAAVQTRQISGQSRVSGNFSEDEPLPVDPSVILVNPALQNPLGKAFYDVPLEDDLCKAVYQELSTEEEDGSTVKVVHFGVV